MYEGIYSSPSYALGTTESYTTQAQAKAALKAMQRSLRGWLKFRGRMDEAADGQRMAPRLGRRFGSKPLPPSVIRKTLDDERFYDEQDLARQLHQLLVECGANIDLPSPNVAADPNAAVRLAEIVLKGACPGETVDAPQAQGIVWFVLAIPLAAVVLVISQVIKSKADVAKERERIRCIQSGHCTDYGFWLKVASVGIVGWLAWDKFGIREAIQKKK